MGKLTKREAEQLESGELVSVPARYLPLAKRIAELEESLSVARGINRVHEQYAAMLEAALREVREIVLPGAVFVTPNDIIKALFAIDAALGEGGG